MPKYLTNPNIMNTDLGVVASGALSAPQTSTSLPTTQQPTPLTGSATPAAQDLSKCHPCTAREIMFPSKHGVRIVTGTGTRPMCCPKITEVDPGGIVQPGDTGGGGGGGEPEGTGLGEFSWPQEMLELYQLLMGRGSELLGSPGFSDQALSYAFGNDFEKIRGQEAAKRQQMMDYQSKSGMLGTGSGAQQMMDLAWGTEGDISTLMRDIFLQNEGQKRADIGLGQNIFGGGMDFSQALEAINAARRGEGTQSLALLLQLLQILKG